MGNSKDYNEVIFAGKQADEARCGWMRLKEKTTEVQGPRIPPIYLAVVCRRRPSTHPTLHQGKVARTSVALWRFWRSHWLVATKASSIAPSMLHLRKEAWELGLENSLRPSLFSPLRNIQNHWSHFK
jgi:hypothetical protein